MRGDTLHAVLTRTTTQLLDSLKDSANEELWNQFDERYRPVLIAFARSQGLDSDTAADVAQSALADFATAYRRGEYQREKGRLSSWIMGIAKNRIRDSVRRQRRNGKAAESVAAEEAADEAGWQAAFESARQRVIFQRALEVLRHESRTDRRTIQAFELCALRGVPAEAAGMECGMSTGEVYVAKNRVISRLRDIVAALTREFEDA